MRTTIFLIIGLLGSLLNIEAQNLTIRGSIFDEGNNQPLAFANVVLQTEDSVFLQGISTNEKGQFVLKNIQAGNYWLEVSSVGYLTERLDLRGVTSSINLEVIFLREDVVALKDVEVTASNLVNKSDRKIIFPNQRQIDASTNGIGLLQNMMLPKVQVNLMTNSVGLIGQGELQLRINGAQVTEKEIIALQPKDIIRIEYIENPGLRYGNAEAVLNYITRKHETGGSVGIEVMQSPHVMFNNTQASVKLNHKRSEFGVTYSLLARDFQEAWRDNEEVFRYLDQPDLIRQEIGSPGDRTFQMHNLSLNYNYTWADESYLHVNLNYMGDNEPHEDFYSLLRSSSFTQSNVQMADLAYKKIQRPSLDIYYSKMLKNKQNLTFNVVGTYNNIHQIRSYREWTDDVTLTDVMSDVEGDKYSVIAEAIYEKEFEKGRLNIGLKHTHAFSENQYAGTEQFFTKMKEADSYAFAEFAGKVHKLDYTFGVGVSRFWIKQDGFNDYDTYTFRPRISLKYNFRNNFFVRLNGRLENVSPSLSELSAVDQLIDSLQIKRGNPELSSYKQYQGDLDMEYQLKPFTLLGSLRYINAPHAIMESTRLEEGMFVRTFDNQDRWQKINASLTLRSGLLFKMLQVSLTGGVNSYWSDGLDYSHHYTNWYGNIQAMAMYKNWMAMFQWQSNWNHFWGESIYGGENMHALMVMYRHKNLMVGVGAMNPFADNFKIVNENWNKMASYKRTSYVNESSKMFFVRLAWNFSFGRKYNAKPKKLNNQDTDTGILNAGK
ncbi:TonB-dependent receptor [Parabacteroides sp.]|uniref:TonB-dependent receptor n=1 Tax=Parabacteroides sp. TaxID=1869337 RepID=UPI00257E4D08|nr:TonB-dependent receptor [Parabacteroides sp.]